MMSVVGVHSWALFNQLLYNTGPAFWCKPKKKFFLLDFCSNFFLFCIFLAFKHKKHWKRIFWPVLECAAPKCWSKYTTFRWQKINKKQFSIDYYDWVLGMTVINHYLPFPAMISLLVNLISAIQTIKFIPLKIEKIFRKALSMKKLIFKINFYIFYSWPKQKIKRIVQISAKMNLGIEDNSFIWGKINKMLIIG